MKLYQRRVVMNRDPTQTRLLNARGIVEKDNGKIGQMQLKRRRNVIN